jgi:ADP-ribosylglycohydrolase
MSGAARSLEARAFACLAFGVVGDAMGTPTEALEPAEIEARFGWVDSFEGDGTDDTLMCKLLIDALVETGGRANSDDWARKWLDNQPLIFGEKMGRFFQSVLHGVRKLHYGVAPRRVFEGNMPSSSSAMAIAPVGIVNAGNPRAAAAQATEIAGLIHNGENGFCQDGAAAIAAAIAAGLAPGATLETVKAAAIEFIKPWSGAEMRRAIADAIGLAEALGDYKSFRAAYHAKFRQRITCDSRETVPAALALSVLAKGDPRLAIEYSANFGRDTDTIGAMAGAVCGALSGAPDMRLIDRLPADTRAALSKDAADLLRVGAEKARAEIASLRFMAG